MQKDIEMILIPLNVFSNYAYYVKISNLYFLIFLIIFKFIIDNVPYGTRATDRQNCR